MSKQAHYPVNIVFITVLQADDGPPDVMNGVIRNGAELKTTFKALAPVLIGSVDFEKEQLIFVTLGQRDLDAPEAQIYSISHLDRGSISHLDRGKRPPLITVSYREIRNILPTEDKNNPRFPIHVVKLKKLRGETVFYKDKKD
jgi:hypothetical protein